MARFYLVSNNFSKQKAIRAAKSLSESLKGFGFPHETKITKSADYGYLIWSTATIGQIQRLQDFKNTYPRDVFPSLKNVEDENFLKHLKKAKKSINKTRKKETSKLKSEMTRVSGMR
jgi:hypothetical protein